MDYIYLEQQQYQKTNKIGSLFGCLVLTFCTFIVTILTVLELIKLEIGPNFILCVGNVLILLVICILSKKALRIYYILAAVIIFIASIILITGTIKNKEDLVLDKQGIVASWTIVITSGITCIVLIGDLGITALV